jgi:hypothetical protein
VNRDVPLRVRGGFWRRASIAVAVTTGSVARAGQRDDLLANHGLVVGFGYRVFEFFQVSAGALVLRAADRDPVVDHATTRVTPYAAISVDATLVTIFGAFTGAIFGGTLK